MSPKRLLTGALACALALTGGTLLASGHEDAAGELDAALHLTPNLDNGRKVFQLCNVCHTPEGWGNESGMYPQIAGQLASVTVKQLADIRARNRDNPTMRPFTSPQQLGGVQEIADVAAYIAALPMNPSNGVGAGNDLAHGEQLYKDNCVDCHGDRGQGDEKDHIPLIQGQHYRYLVRQFDMIRSGQRRNADPKMAKQIRRFSPRDVAAVMDYVSRLKPPADKLAEPGWQNPDFPKYSRKPMPHTPIYGRPQPPRPQR